MPLRLASSRDLPTGTMTPEQEWASGISHYKLTRIIEGDYFQVNVTEYKSAENMATILAETYKRRGLTDWALFIEDQVRMLYHLEYRGGQEYRNGAPFLSDIAPAVPELVTN